MLVTRVIKKYEVIPADAAFKVDHVMVIKPLPEQKDPDAPPLPNRLLLYFPPGVLTYTDYPKDYNIYCIMDDELGYSADDDDPVGPIFAIPFPKAIGNIGVSTAEPSKTVTVLDNAQVKPNYKTLRSEDGSAAISVSNDSIVLRVGDTAFVVSNGKILHMGELVEYNLPTKSQAIVKETGVMRFLPKAFVPPLCFPDYMPDVELMLMVSKQFKEVKDLKDILRDYPDTKGAD